MAILLRALLSVGLGLFAFGACAAGEVRILDPWVQAAPPNAKVLAAYLELHNGGTKTQVVTAVSSPFFERVEIHRTIVDQNMASMELLKELTILPDATITLKPGGLHFMLIGARKKLKVGDTVPLSLTLKDGHTLSVDAAVRAARLEQKPAQRNADHAKHGSHAR